MSVSQLSERFRLHTGRLVSLIRSFTEQNFTQKPADGGWSALEVSEHLLIFDRHLNKVLGSLDKPAERDPMAKVPEYTPRVTNLGTKLEAPPFLVPTGVPDTPEAMAVKISAERDKVLEAMEQKDMSLISSGFPHRLFGEMTAMEWINFIDMHTSRHMPQLQRLADEMH